MEGDEIQATLVKDNEYYNVGQTALPLRCIDDSELIPFSSPSEIERRVIQSHLLSYMFLSAKDHEVGVNAIKRGQTEIMDTFWRIRQKILDLWIFAYQLPQV